MEYAFVAPETDRPDVWPNLRTQASTPWIGLTAWVNDKPYLVIDKAGNEFTLEDQEGTTIKASYFRWEQPRHERNKLVAASRRSDSPLSKGQVIDGQLVGDLYYHEDTGEWLPRVGHTGRFLDFDFIIDHFERNKWSKSALNVQSSKLEGNFYDARRDKWTSFKEKEFQSTGYWHVEASDGREYFIAEDGRVLDEHDNLVGGFDTSEYTNWLQPEKESAWSERVALEQRVADWIQKVAGESYQGFIGVPGLAEGVAVHLDKQSREEIEELLANLPGHKEDEDRQRSYWRDLGFDPYNNPYVNRGGSNKEAVEFKPGPGGQGVTYAPGVIAVVYWATPDQNWLYEHPRCAGVVAGTGGVTSHAVVVMRGKDQPAILSEEAVASINGGDDIRMDGDKGLVHVNGGSGEDFSSLGPGQKARAATVRWVWSNGNKDYAAIDQDDPNREDTLHQTMIMDLAMTNRWDFESATFGVIYEDGTVEVVAGAVADQADLENWLRTEFPEVTDIVIQEYGNVYG